MNAILTIGIPTFQRPDKLRAAVDALAPQLDSRCVLRVVDNASATPVAEVLAEHVKALSARGVSVEIVRNRHNIGMNGNVLRCFELCETEWLHVLCDDDLPDAQLVRTVFETIGAHPEATLLYFSSSFEQFEKPFTARGAAGMLASIRTGSSLVFLPNIVYRRTTQRHLADGYNAANTYAAFVVLGLRALGEEGTTAFSPKRLVEYRPAPAHEKWPAIRVALGLGSLLELPFDEAVRRELGRLVQRMIGPPQFFGVQLLVDKAGPQSSSYRKFVFSQIRRRLFAFAPTTVALRAWVFEQLFRAPRLSMRALKLAYRLRKGRGYFERFILAETVRNVSNRG